MCLAADVPLIESGTTGFNGQVQVIKKDETECYDCTPKAAPKSFAVCTIRSTPSQPIHCIVWGKSYLFAELFGTSEDDAPELDHTEDADNADEVANLQKEAQALKRIRNDMGSEGFPRAVFDKVFAEDINRLRSMEDMWKTKTPTTALDYDALAKEALSVAPTIAHNDQVVWNTAENFAVFVDSLRRLSQRLEGLRADAETGNAAPVLGFDKDDVDTLDFVVASANLRSIIFGIEARSKFDIKRKFASLIYLGSECANPACRDGWQHHPCHCDNQRHDCRSVCPTGFQSDAVRRPKAAQAPGQDGLPHKIDRARHYQRSPPRPKPRVPNMQHRACHPNC